MTRILVQRGSSSSSSNPSGPPSSLLPQSGVPQDPGGIDDGLEDDSEINNVVLLPEINNDPTDKEKGSDHMVVDSVRNSETCGSISSDCSPSQIVTEGSNLPPPPVPPPKPPATSLGARRLVLGCSNAGRVGSPRRQLGWPVGTRLSPSESRPSSPRLYAEGEGYNSADEQSPCFVSSYDDVVQGSRR